LWRATGLPLPTPVYTALDTVADGLVPVALVTLGAQMAVLKVPRLSRPLGLSLALRLLVGPVLSFALVIGMKMLGAPLHGDLAQALVTSASYPTAVNSALVAIEYDNEPEFASAAVFYSTLISAITVSLTIYLVRDMGLLA
jgi:predicted permease